MAAGNGGLIPWSAGGSGYNPSNTMGYPVISGEATDLLQGDVVKCVNNGTVVAMTAVGDTPVVGVFLGCSYTNSDGQPVYSNKYTDTIAGEDIIANVLINPLQLYKVRIANSDANTTLTRVTASFLNFDIEFNAGDTTTGMSGMCLDSGTTGATTAANLRVVGLTNDDSIDPLLGSATTTYSHAIVMIDPEINYWTNGPGL